MNETVLEDAAKFFWLADGRGLRSIKQLLQTIPSLSPETYRHHVTEEKNDFANWLIDVFHEETIANRIKGCRTKEEFEKRLLAAIDQQSLADLRSLSEKKLRERQSLERERSQNVVLGVDSQAKQAATIESLLEKERSLRLAITDARKKGHNPNLCEFVLRKFRPKLSYARTTGLDVDFDKAEAVLHEAEAELQDALAEQRIDVKHEVELLSGVKA